MPVKCQHYKLIRATETSPPEVSCKLGRGEEYISEDEFIAKYPECSNCPYPAEKY